MIDWWFPFYKKRCHPSHWRTHINIVQRACEKPPRCTARYERCALSRLIQMMFDGPADILWFLEGKFLTGKSTGTPQYFMVINWGKTHGFRFPDVPNKSQCVEVSVVNQWVAVVNCVPKRRATVCTLPLMVLGISIQQYYLGIYAGSSFLLLQYFEVCLISWILNHSLCFFQHKTKNTCKHSNIHLSECQFFEQFDWCCLFLKSPVADAYNVGPPNDS